MLVTILIANEGLYELDSIFALVEIIWPTNFFGKVYMMNSLCFCDFIFKIVEF
jgi:hypothetical protein